MADRFDEILEEMRQDRAEARRERADWSARFAMLQEEATETLRFVGELNRRSEVVFQELVLSQREMREEIRASTKQIEASTEATKAHRKAIFALIDRLQGGGGLAPAG